MQLKDKYNVKELTIIIRAGKLQITLKVPPHKKIIRPQRPIIIFSMDPSMIMTVDQKPSYTWQQKTD